MAKVVLQQSSELFASPNYYAGGLTYHGGGLFYPDPIVMG